jgi:hypothetical protein
MHKGFVVQECGNSHETLISSPLQAFVQYLGFRYDLSVGKWIDGCHGSDRTGIGLALAVRHVSQSVKVEPTPHNVATLQLDCTIRATSSARDEIFSLRNIRFNACFTVCSVIHRDAPI